MATIKTHNILATTELTHNGTTKTLKEWSDILNIPYATMRMRYTRGVRGDDLFHRPVHRMLSHYDRLKLLDPDLKLRLIAHAEELSIDPMELMHTLIERGLQKLASTS